MLDTRPNLASDKSLYLLVSLMKKQNFQPIPIATYPLHFSDDVLDESKVLLDQQQLELIKRDRRKGYWLFELKGTHKWEVEVLLGRSKIRSFSCDCLTFQKQRVSCCHIAAAIRLALQLSEEKKKSPHTAAPRQLNSKMVVNGISDKDLREFVLQYAGQNQHFALLLKAKFAHLIELDQNLQKYYLLCKRYASTLGTRGLTKQRLKRLINYVDDLLDLADDLRSIENYREAFHLIHGTLRFLNLRLVVYQEIVLAPQFSKAHRKLDDLLSHEIAPKLQREILQEFQQMIELERYVVLDNLNLYHLLIKHAFSDDARDKIMKLLESKIESEQDNHVAISTLCEIYHQRGMDIKLIQLVLEHRSNFRIVKDTLTWLEAKPESVKLLRDLATRLYIHADGQRLKKISMIYQMRVMQDQNEQTKLAVDFFLSHPDIDSYHLIKEQLRGSYSEVSKQIILLLEEGKNFGMLTKILAEEESWDALFFIVEREGDLELLLPNLGHLYKHKYGETEQLLLNLLRDFLNIHVGQSAFKFIQKIIRQLQRGQMPKLIDAIYEMIYQDFSDRTLLTKSLTD